MNTNNVFSQYLKLLLLKTKKVRPISIAVFTVCCLLRFKQIFCVCDKNTCRVCVFLSYVCILVLSLS